MHYFNNSQAFSSDSLIKSYNLLKSGFTPIFTKDGTKTPALKWKTFQTKKPSPSLLQKNYKTAQKFNNSIGVAIVTGTEFNKGYLAVIDCDTQESFERWKKIYPNTLHVTSSRGGHLYLETVKRYKSKRIDKDTELKGFGSYVLAPNNITGDGELTHIPNNNKIQVVDKLDAEEISPLPIPSFVSKILKGDTKSYASRSEAEYAAILHLVSKEFSYKQVETVFESFSYSYGKYIDDLDGLQRSYNSAVNYIKQKKNSPSKTTLFELTLGCLHLFKEDLKWDWLTAKTDVGVYTAFLNKAKTVRNLDIAYCYDDICVDANVSKMTVKRCIERLIGVGLITKIKNATWNYSAVYRLNHNPYEVVKGSNRQGKIGSNRSIYLTQLYESIDVNNLKVLLNLYPIVDKSIIELIHRKTKEFLHGNVIDTYQKHDLFHGRKGRTNFIVYKYLVRFGKIKITHMLNKTGMCFKTAKNRLNDLIEMGLVGVDKTGYFVKKTLASQSLHDLAEKAGKLGVKAALKAKLFIKKIDFYECMRFRYLCKMQR